MNHYCLLFAFATFLASTTTNRLHVIGGRVEHHHGDDVPSHQDFEAGLIASNQRQRRKMQPRIVGGVAAGLTEFPFYAQWWGDIDSSDSGACGASLIHADILLTAAHCYEIAYNIQVVVGAYYDMSDAQGDPRTVTKRKIHPDYNSDTNFNDYLVMKLDSGVPTKTVILNSKSSSPVVNQVLTTIGIGYTSEGGTSSSTLRKVNVNNVASNICKKDYAPVADVIPFNATVQICAGVPGGGKDSCQGDSGGPILTSSGIHVGVVSDGNGCGRVGYPGIYARTSAAYTWIRKQVCALSDYPPTYCYTTAPKATKVRLDVFYDKYSKQTAFKVFNSSSNVVYTSSAGKDSSLVSRTLSLTPGYYYWQFSDTGKNGFCCSNGYGFIAAFAIVNGLYTQITPPIYGIFSETYSANVPMPVPKGSTSTISSTGSGTTLWVEVYYDRYPAETAFTIYNSANTVVGSSALALSSYAETSKFYKFVLTPGRYTVQFADTNADGYCCEYGIGYYAVYAVVNGAYRALVAPTYGLFSKTKNVAITVPSKTTSSSKAEESSILSSPLPPPPPSIFASVCRDYPSQFSYNVTLNNGSVSEGNQTCLWLNDHPDFKERLCQPPEQAYKTCPKTCGKCVDSCEGQDNSTVTFLVGNETHKCAWLSDHSSLWPTACTPDMPAYSYCKHVCHSCET